MTAVKTAAIVMHGGDAAEPGAPLEEKHNRKPLSAWRGLPLAGEGVGGDVALVLDHRAQDAVGALDAQQVLHVVEDDDAVLSGAAVELGGQLEDPHQYPFGLGARVGLQVEREAARSERDAEARAG